MRRLFFALALPRSRRNLTTQPRPIKKFAPPAALSWGSASRPPARRARGFGPPQGVRICFFAPPLNLQKARQHKRWENGIKWYIFLGYNGIPFMRQQIEGGAFCKLTPFALGRFLQIEGGAKKQIRTPAGTKSPRAPRGRVTVLASRQSRRRSKFCNSMRLRLEIVLGARC